MIGWMDSAPTVHHATWLCPDAASRERLLDMDARLKRPRAAAFGVLAIALIVSASDLGLEPIGLLAAVVLGFALVSHMQSRLRAPEYAIVASWVFAQVGIAVAVALTGGVHSFAMSWLVIPIVSLPARFGTRGLAAGVAFTSLLVVGIAVAPSGGHVVPEYFGIVYPVATLIAVALLLVALLKSDLDHRTEAVIDGLTGMLNRRALRNRLDELTAQATLTKQPVAVIAGDIDRFKRVNDEHGHAKGDAVLVDIAYLIRKHLRAFDLAYRLGGEEFLILLPGATAQEATNMAENLRAAIAAEPVAGLPVTMSFGVAGSGPEGFVSETVLAAADDALYEAKASGRDQVVVAGRPAAEPALAG